MNISTNNISFAGKYKHTDNSGKIKEQFFTNDQEVLESLGKIVQSGVLTKKEIEKDDILNKARLTVNDVFDISVVKQQGSDVEGDNLSVKVSTKDENGVNEITIDNYTLGKNTELIQQLLTFVDTVFDKIQQGINDHVINLLSPKKETPPVDDK